ncbi:MAG: 16S rRNA (guanine(527)-N(7))-methyltransferase RsmG [Oscillospiraceae bacterium]|nr:16S rRNA (guanine(527)-N(7))-methyltransferase RsmG [Oscillospiraceae bacterium]
MEDVIIQGLTEMGLPAARAADLATYSRLLLEGNRVMNLTSVTEPEDVARMHMLDCAALLNCADLCGKTVLDVGTGAGFPGVVLKILEPSLELTLLDSTEKRLEWLKDVCRTLHLENVRFIHARAEEAAHLEELREHFDVTVSRAVASMSILAELCLPFLKIGGQLLAMKAGNSGQEISRAATAIVTLGGEPESTYMYTIPGTDVVRAVARAVKRRPTDPRYPRRWAKIRNSPL